jgi:hemerythrin HHE cation binding domain-containing protein
MSKLVDELKSDHITLKHALKQAADFTIPPADRVAILNETKLALLNHLEKENRELYPALRTLAETDHALRSTLETFAKDMEAIATQALDFFAKYHDPTRVADQFKNNIHYSIEFGRDLERLIILLGLRIGREERTLYAEYDRGASTIRAA